MNALRIEADESASKVEELQKQVKTLEQENLAKEQEITSLSHKNTLLEKDVEKLENLHKDAKQAVNDSAQHGTQNETLTRRLQLLEEEAELNDKNLRETNDKYVTSLEPQFRREGDERKLSWCFDLRICC
jgi:tropomyosin